ncbi:hypothetical protein GNP92_11135 [Paenibacillus timonensis]|nr:hypothetical protein [Paenibacillus timonensis]MUG86894.1 hypothetical protein [Paenibacillus timonensis]
MNQTWEDILILGGEGGSVTLLGLRGQGETWIFRKKTNEGALADILDGEDLSELVQYRSMIVTNWVDALSLLGRSWMKLRPLYVHPQFKGLVWNEVRSEIKLRTRRDWEMSCLL